MKFTLKTILPFIYLIFFWINIQSQSTVIDSLKNELQNHTKKDSVRVNTINALAFEYCLRDIDTVYTYIKESQEISNAIDYTKGKAESLYMSGYANEIQSNYSLSLQNYNLAIELYETINSKKGIAKCFIGIATVHYYQGNYNNALQFYEKSIEVNRGIGNQKAVASGWNNVGVVHVALGDYKKAILNYEKALNTYKKIKYRKGVSSCYNNIGIIYHDQGNYPLALSYYNKSLAIAEAFGDALKLAVLAQNIGGIHYNLKNYEKAILNYEKAFEIYKKNGNKKNLANILINIGVTYIDKEDYPKAEEILTKSLKLNIELDDKNQIAIASNNLGWVYLKLDELTTAQRHFEKAKAINIVIENPLSLTDSHLGISEVNFHQKKYAKALTNALKSKTIAEKLGLVEHQRNVFELLSKIYEQTGKYQKAFKSHRQFKILNDSLFNKENVEKIAQLEYEYKYKQALDSAGIRELQLTETVTATNENLEKSKQNYLWAIIGFLLVSMLLGGVIFYLKYRNVKSKTENITIEQKLLRSQMTPHFIFNSLSVLQGMILNNEEEKSISYLSKFSKLLRSTLENSRHKTVALSEELSAIDSYIGLQNLDVSPPFNYKLSIDSEIDTTTFNIPPMLIQPFIENVIEHAFIVKKENKEIKVEITLKDNTLVCTIADNGKGISMDGQKTNKNKNSLATTITTERLKMLSKGFKVEGSVNVTNRKLFGEQGTLVTLVIPYKIDSDSL